MPMALVIATRRGYTYMYRDLRHIKLHESLEARSEMSSHVTITVRLNTAARRVKRT